MTDVEYLIGKFDGAVLLLPGGLRRIYRGLTSEQRAKCEELRLRVGQRPAAVLAGEETELEGEKITSADLEAALSIATNASFHAVKDSIKYGFITANGGYRIGICGELITKNGEITGYRAVSSLCIRIPRQIKSVQSEISGILEEALSSVLIISPPGGGKTTFLRELVRYVSDLGHRVSLVDERGEVAAMVRGVPQMDVGKTTDVLEGCKKAEGAVMMLRAMNPEVIALDEITAAEDTKAVNSAANCGVYIFATVHGNDVSDVRSKVLYKGLLDTGVFKTAVIITGKGSMRQYKTVRLEEIYD